MSLFLITALAYGLLIITYTVYKNSDGEFAYVVLSFFIQYIIPFALFYFAGVNA